MQIEGNILKMRTELATPVNYFLPVGSNEIVLNELIGREISMHFTGQINCISCGKQQVFKSTYLFGAFSPITGNSLQLIPIVFIF
jgi:hypothetical protein